MLTKLIAINNVLAAMGIRAVTSATSTHPDVVAASNTIDRVSRMLQSDHPSYNSENLTLAISNVGHVILPSNVLEVDAVNALLKYTQRGTRLYDITNNTYVFTAAVDVKITSLLEYDDLPFHAANYIMYQASFDHYVDQDGDTAKSTKLERRVDKAQSLYEKTEFRAKDINALCSPTAAKIVSGISTGGVSRNPQYPGG